METCSQCFGTGHAQCFNCHGGWVTSHSGPTGGIEMCGMCGGSSKIRCSTCGGSGLVPAGTKPRRVDPKKLGTVLILLAGVFVVFFVLPKLFFLFLLAKYGCLLTLSCQ
jgi:hypothetical protein